MSTQTSCAYCGVGCGLTVNYERGHYLVSGDPSHPSNLGAICQKGGTLGQTMQHKGRLLFPSVNGQTSTWSQALTEVATVLRETCSNFGPEALGFYVSGQMLTEDYYVANKLMKGFLGSGNIDTNSRLCMASTVAAHKRAFGSDTVPACYQDIDLADLFVIVGSNMAHCHPVLFDRVRDRQAQGARVLVIDPRKNATSLHANLHISLKPGTDVALFQGLLNFIAQYGGIDNAYINQHVAGAHEAIAAASSYSIPKVAAICEVNERPLAEFYKQFLQHHRTLSFFSQGLNQSSCGTEKVLSLLNCHLATGRVGKPGASPFSLTGQNNAMGGREVGGLANQLAAHMDYTQDNLKTVQEFWQSPHISRKPGLKAIELFEAMHAGKIKAVWIMATNPMVSLPDSDYIREALRRCPHVIVSEPFLSSMTVKHASIKLPACTWGEKDGMVSNSERRISRQRAFASYPGMAMPDWWMITQVAHHLGFSKHFQYNHPFEIFKEHARLSGFRNHGQRRFNISAFANMTKQEYEEFKPRHWPVSADGLSQARVFDDGIFDTSTGKAQMSPVQYHQASTFPQEQGATWTMITGRVKGHWHTMTRTCRVPSLNRIDPEPMIEIHPADLESLLQDQTVDTGMLRVYHGGGEFIAPYLLNEHIHRHTIFIPFHWSEKGGRSVLANRMTLRRIDPYSGQPDYKLTGVSVEMYEGTRLGILASRSALPLAKNHFDYLIEIPMFDHVYYRFADSRKESSQCFLDRHFPEQSSYDRIQLQDEQHRHFRYAFMNKQKLEHVIYLSQGAPFNIKPSKLSYYFKKNPLNSQDRLALLDLSSN
ncbi:molybdopterin oxidoreductase family protein [Pseudobacteriovorax antillogorgiicola]|uniref:Assimilatory nitrate reductase (NADH) alpha subunit apoprotein n=1 Tax=Pseudobacteriovorax antillogorgiicola TaxID=1513793 RepID=A0A1Y6BXC6_9BACT|nr:molybdopterin-dependent oxidoreductase [Pseudobacteriovorax antillogorgiicola]TCS52329.1 assimilatory nitrate reductase (NADH) alpha subunit apoprotein [Pseudobacteriovorax antillogorgiicola]SMF29957.1 assimilatory nitrate reductase (NADH) alpha subunit apoprotein [Pseudobacteriovorax antillogorgiicola]